MASEILDYYAGCYTDDRKDPFVSPLFGDLRELPPSLIFVGDEEIMRSDAVLMHSKLLSCGAESHLTAFQWWDRKSSRKAEARCSRWRRGYGQW